MGEFAPIDAKAIGEHIRNMMRWKGITFRDLAQEAGVSTRTLQEAIKNPGSRRIKTINKIIETLKKM